MGDIGKTVREVEFEPIPTTAPVTEPAPSVPTPVKEPQPA